MMAAGATYEKKQAQPDLSLNRTADRSAEGD
jgi:hypothetical protein